MKFDNEEVQREKYDTGFDHIWFQESQAKEESRRLEELQKQQMEDWKQEQLDSHRVREELILHHYWEMLTSEKRLAKIPVSFLCGSLLDI